MLSRTVYALGTACIVAIGGWLCWKLWPASGSDSEAAAVVTLADESTLVTLQEQKLASAAIQFATTQESIVQPTRTIAGRLDYDQDRHVTVNSACKGIITQILVRPGDEVRAGQVVATVSSPELGIARSNASHQLAELRLAEEHYQWRKKLCDGVRELVELIREGKSPEEIEARLKDEALGEYRERLVTAYTRSRLASQLAGSSRDAASRGAISGRLQQQRESEQQASEAAVQSVLEYSQFEAKQLCKEAEAKLADAGRQLDVSLQQLNTLLGPAANKMTIDDLGKAETTAISEVNLVSPIDGSVEERWLSATERVSAGDTVFTIANTSHLWAVADIRERDWSAIDVQVGQEVRLTTPAIPDQTYLGRVLIVGRRLDPTTGAAPLVAELQVSDSRLRPGLFIRMTVPSGEARPALVVPEPAVVVHEGQSFVFIPESECEFRRVDVQVGVTEDEMTEITSGLRPGDQVAVTGVFKLKSELLLFGEEQ